MIHRLHSVFRRVRQRVLAKEVVGRLVRGVAATALGPVVSALIQVGAVPILLHIWGAARYGDWLVLSAIPSYLGLSDLGFGNASGSDMTVRVAAGDRTGALRTFQSSWILVTVFSSLCLVVAGAVAMWAPWAKMLKLSTLSSHDAARILALLGCYVLVGQQTGVFESGYRADGNFATGTALGTAIRFVEWSAAIAAAVLGASLVVIAGVYLAVRTISTCIYLVILLQKSPWLKLGIKHARLGTIRDLAAPAIGFMALPAGQALSVQGFTILIGAELGSVAVVAFSTARTMTRVGFQFFNVISVALWPELSAAFGAGRLALARELHRRACQTAVCLSLLCGVILWVAGPRLYHVWTRGAVGFQAGSFHILLIVVVASSFWYVSSTVPMSTNSHSRIAASYLAGTAFSLMLGWMLIPHLGLDGAALALLAIDLAMLWIVLPAAIRQVGDTPRGFWTLSGLAMPFCWSGK